MCQLIVNTDTHTVQFSMYVVGASNLQLDVYVSAANYSVEHVFPLVHYNENNELN